MQFEHINDEDAMFEHFWYMFKDSVYSFEKQHSTVALKELVLRIDMVSSQLNELKVLNEYHEIAVIIETFLEDFFWSGLHAVEDKYYIGICYTNIKRWFNAVSSSKVKHIISVEFHVIRIIYDALDKGNMDISSNIKEFHTLFPAGLKDYKKIVDVLLHLSIKADFSPILNKIIEQSALREQLDDYIMHVYNIKLPKGICNGRKILTYLVKSTNNV
jgi:hypothetical protein